MITIEKRKVEISIDELKAEIANLCKLIKKHNPMGIGIGHKQLNDHFGIKMKQTDFYKLSDQLEYKVYRGKFWLFVNNPDLKKAVEEK